MPIIKLRVDEDNVNERLDVYLSNNTSLSRSNIQKLIESGKVLLNDKACNKKTLTKLNDDIYLEYEDVSFTEIKPCKMDLDIVYEDDDLIVINKKKGVVVHPAPGNFDNTLVNGLIYHFNKLSDINGYYRPGIVHRIDKDTSGLLVVCKTNSAHIEIAKQLQDKTCFRKYYAIVDGIIENDEGEINAPIARSKHNRQKMEVSDINGKDAITDFRVLDRFSNYTLLDLELKTGRTHQIRVHTKFINHPVTNDPKYNKRVLNDSGQYLHAYFLSFIHPTTKKRVEFKVDMPMYMKEFLNQNGSKIA